MVFFFVIGLSVLVHMLRWIYLRRTIHRENYTREGHTHKWRHHHRHVAQKKNSMLRCICTAIDHSRRQNVVSISRANSAAPRLPLFCSCHILTSSVIHDWTDAWQHEIYLSSSKGLDENLGVVSVEFYLDSCFVGKIHGFVTQTLPSL